MVLLTIIIKLFQFSVHTADFLYYKMYHPLFSPRAGSYCVAAASLASLQVARAIQRTRTREVEVKVKILQIPWQRGKQ